MDIINLAISNDGKPIAAIIDQAFGSAENVGNEKTSASSAPSTLTQVTASTTFNTDAENGDFGAKELTQTSTENPDKGTGEAESKLAERIADTLRNYLAFDEVANEWFMAKHGLWKPISERRAMNVILRALSLQMPQGFSAAKLNNIKTFLAIYLLLEAWEQRRHLLPLANGVFNVETMQLEEYTHQHRFNWQLPYSFDPNASFNVIKRWLWDATSQDIETVNIIRAFFKMALVGGDVQKFLEVIGPGGTGKSTLIRLLVAFIGEKNHAATDLKNLEGNRFEAAALYGKRLALISDSSRYGGEVAVLKAITGGDPVRLEKKNQQQSGSFVFDGVVVIASNEAIQSSDYTSGLIRRRMPVTFNKKVTDADKAKWANIGGIEAAMRQELPGLLNWVLSMPDVEVKKVIGGINGAMTQAQRQHLVETNKLAAWMDDNLIIKSDSVLYIGKSMKSKQDYGEISRSASEKLYSNYESWCSDYAVNPVALQRFTSNLIDICEQLKIEVQELNRDKHGKRIKGLAIRSDLHQGCPTPVTRKLLSVEGNYSGAEAVLKQTLDSADGADGVDKNLSVTVADVEVF